MNAIVFGLTQVLQRPPDAFALRHAKRTRRWLAVLSRDEVGRLLGPMAGVYALMAGLMYGAGMRLMEGVRVRVMDVDFEQMGASKNALFSSVQGSTARGTAVIGDT
ncbi:MAG: hypothetical protein GKR94_18285 [Gammaproteobacteria bacterium]|nr:hypothetical protein [Gammaproteobacteria bacterium]